MKQPVINTERLILRPFDQCDARQVQYLAGAKEITDMTARIPHPYPDGEAESWISSHRAQWENGTLVVFAITLNEGNQLVGAISLMGIENSEAELGYWVGVDFWGNGYATEACSAIVKFGFDQLTLKRINAHHLTSTLSDSK